MGATEVVKEFEPQRRRAWSEHLRGRLRERAHLGVAVCGLLDGVAVDPERHVIQELAAVHLGDVDLSLDAVGEGIE